MNKVYAIYNDVTTKCMMLNVDLFKIRLLYGDDWTVEDFKIFACNLRFNRQCLGYSFDSNRSVYIWFYLFGGNSLIC